jgi:hypothetical protein
MATLADTIVFGDEDHDNAEAGDTESTVLIEVEDSLSTSCSAPSRGRSTA